MSGFEANWLALREPADRAARAMSLVDKLARFLDPMADCRLLDIGCGTGSTWRSLSDHLPARANWLLLDHDPMLLEEARLQIGADPQVGFRHHDLGDIDHLPLDGISMLTASALFDLCSDDFCGALVSLIAERKIGLYAALNYDGMINWSASHPLDGEAVAAFNSHQRTDKGFGVALGPDATSCLAGHLEREAYSLTCESSPWRMDQRSGALQQAFLEGFRKPLREIGSLSEAQIEAWLSYRISAINLQGSLCEVGHTDLLALPA